MRKRTRKKIKPTAAVATAAVALLSFCLHGCFSIQPTYTKEKAAEAVIEICRDEYGLKINAWPAGDTLYVYLPVASLTTSDRELAGSIQKNITRLAVAATRICLSMNPRMEFLVIVVTDTKQHGIEYRTTNFVPDLVKLQYNAISRNDFAARSLISITQNPLAIGDEEGKYILKEPVKKPDFICAQIAQNISAAAARRRLQNAAAMPPKAAEVSLKDGILKIALLAPVDEKTAPGSGEQFTEEILAIAARAVREYDDFTAFSVLELYGPPPGSARSEFSRKALMSHLRETRR